ncbi:MAG: hypothetical protein EOP33_07690 [Rickettsiaceae bacterium]|nr:MAG: hypothetical protein EOP33_07690 [Rickettsiaceae bacterium]
MHYLLKRKIKDIKLRKKRFASHFEIHQHEKRNYDVLIKALNFDERFLVYLQGCFKTSIN